MQPCLAPPQSPCRADSRPVPVRLRAPFLLSTRMAVSLAALLFVDATARPASADEPVAATAGFRDEIAVTEVLLDVVAFDRNGDAVADLGIDDFVVLEDGAPVEATSVSFYSTAYGPSGTLADGPEAEIPASRYFILLFHDPRTRHAQPLHAFPTLLRQFLRAGEQSRAWLTNGLQPSDWAAVVGFGTHGLRVVQDFTQDRERLAAAAESVTRGARSTLPRPSERPRDPRPGEPALRRLLDRQPDQARRGRDIEDALARVAEASAHIIGRKNLLLFTPGIAPPSRQRQTGPRGSRRRHSADHRSGHPYPELEQALNASNVAVYVLDLGGPRPAASEAEVAERSGGAFLAGLRFRHDLEQIADENRGYYLLSYRSTLTREGSGYRTIDVHARDHRITVRARHGLHFEP